MEQKNRGVDTLPVDETVMSILTRRKGPGRQETDHVFPNGNNKRLDNRNLLRAFYAARGRKQGSRDSGSMIFAIPLQPGWFRVEWISTRCRSWGGGRTLRWSCGTPITILKACVVGSK